MTRRSRRRKLRRKLGAALALAAAGLLAAAVIWTLMLPAGGGAPRLVTVEPGQSVCEVACALDGAGLIRSANALVAAAYVSGKWRRIQAGRHELDPGMTPLEILDALCRGSRRAWRWITIPEGYTVRQIAAEVEEKRLAPAASFLTLAGRPEEFDVPFLLPHGSMEGYLFPDTYRIEANETPREIITQMLRRFGQVVWLGLFEGRPTCRGRSLQEIMILASLVEGEAQLEQERPLIAGVLMNRLRQGQRLECDATVQYALGERRRSRLTHEDLSIESAYNTYLHTGLPPGPICNPGEASIKAAMEPARVPFLYYVAKPDGSHIFSNTYAEHQAAIARLREDN